MIASPSLISSVWGRCLLVLGLSVLLQQNVAARTDSPLDTSKALRSINGSWWNHETGQYNSPKGNPYVDNDLRTSGRIGEPPATTNNSSKWSWDLGWLSSALYYMFLSIVVLLAIAGIVILLMHFVRSYRPRADEYQGTEIKIDPTKIEELPFEAVKWSGDPLAEARKLAQQGRFDEAIVYFYGYQLLVLDQSRKIHLHKGKTNRMYIREIESPDLRSIVELTMCKFEEVFFGKHSLSKQSFLEVWNQLDLFHALATQTVVRSAGGAQASAIGVATQ